MNPLRLNRNFRHQIRNRRLPLPLRSPPTAAKKYTGDPISVNLKDVDLKDFFRLIHEISGLNVVLDPAVKGTVTLVLDEVPWDQGLDIVLRNNGLSQEIDGNVLRIATQDTLKREADQRRDLLKAQSDAIETVTTTRVLSYAKADQNMATTLKRFLTPRGDIYSDARSNTLIIRDIPDSIPKIDNLIRQLDRKSRQVEIDARVVQASRSFARDIGTLFAYSTASGGNVFGGNSAVGVSPLSRTVIPPFSSPALINGNAALTPGTPVAVEMPLATNLAAGAPTSGLSYLFTSPNFALDFQLSAMESRGVGKVLSEPRGVTQNNEKLTVKQGEKIPIQTTVNNTVSVQLIDAVLKLEVTPQITADGTVFMDVTVENTQIDNGVARINGTPALATQSTETKVLINDGGTVVIGGVVVSNQTTNVDQVPLLGSMPLIGNLFKRTTVNVSSQELLFFVTPRILPG
jgi:type IV pilus assembly protein PilQ